MLIKSDLLRSLFGGIVALIAMLSFTDILLPTALALSLSVFVFFFFLSALGSTIPIIELMLLISCLQWVAGPFIAYYLGNNHWKYYMSLPEELYMSFISGAVAMFITGYLLFYKRIRILQVGLEERVHLQLSANANLPLTLVVIGLVAHTLAGLVPFAFRFIFFLLDGMQFIGVFYFFFTGHRLKWVAFAFVIILNFSISLTLGLFHNLILWLSFVFIYLNRIYKFNTINNILLIAAGFYFLFLLQGIKGEYREEVIIGPGVKEGVEKNEEYFQTFGRLMSEQMESEKSEDLTFLEMINVRLNQGWIISRVMYYVPRFTPYANGETILDAVKASLLPRFIDPEKKMAGGKENYERFTGFLLDGTSMGISLVGEAYANYGYEGSIYFMLIWGIFISTVVYFIFRLSEYYVSMWLWLPMIFNQVVKAETDLVVVLNYLTKSLVLVILIFIISRRFLKVNL